LRVHEESSASGFHLTFLLTVLPHLHTGTRSVQDHFFLDDILLKWFNPNCQCHHAHSFIKL
jgi:hypothetical protein